MPSLPPLECSEAPRRPGNVTGDASPGVNPPRKATARAAVGTHPRALRRPANSRRAGGLEYRSVPSRVASQAAVGSRRQPGLRRMRAATTLVASTTYLSLPNIAVVRYAVGDGRGGVTDDHCQPALRLGDPLRLRMPRRSAQPHSRLPSRRQTPQRHPPTASVASEPRRR